MAAVPDGLQNAHKDIVHDKGQGAEKINAEIDRGFRQHIFLGNLFQQLYNTADSLIVGNFLGTIKGD